MEKAAEAKLIDWLKGRELSVNKESNGYTVQTIRKTNNNMEFDETEMEAISSLGRIHHITIDFTSKSIWIGVKNI